MTHLIKRSCEIKSEVVSKDEREAGLRAILNYGHTVGHALETVTGYKKYLHGEAVAIGMHIEAKLSQAQGLISAKQVNRIKKLIESYDLPTEIPEDVELNSLFDVMQIDKKTVSGELNFILPEKIGSVKIHKGISRENINTVLQIK